MSAKSRLLQIPGIRDVLARFDRLVRQLDRLEAVVEYLDLDHRRLSAAVRDLGAPARLPTSTSETCDSFDFQWGTLPQGRFMLESPEFRAEAPGYVCTFTGLSAEWFRGKSVLDAGCGNGRYSWALCKLGARVLSIDQSEQGLARTGAACSGFPDHRTRKVDLLKPLPLDEQFDLVWSYGVLHHTGDTHGSFRRLVPLVRPGGYLFLMLYGEPRPGFPEDYRALAEYLRWRSATSAMTFSEKVEALTAAMSRNELMVNGPEHLHGYFDAISPEINDLIEWTELQRWLKDAGFVNARKTVEMRNLHVMAIRSIDTRPATGASDRTEPTGPVPLG